ncbi:MAG: hypothetical protein WCS73_00825 [Lentisphaeria bacterium]
MIMKKILLFNFVVLFVLSLALVSAAAEKTSATEGFEYATLDQLKAEWTIVASGFKAPVKILLNTKDAKEGKKCLELLLPPTKANETARLTLDMSTTVNAKDVAQVRFWLQMQHCTKKSALYWGNKDLKNYFVKYGLKLTENNWQKIYVSKSLFAAEGAAPPAWDAVSRMRISFWFSRNQPANRILIDGMIWDSIEEKPPVILNREWWE